MSQMSQQTRPRVLPPPLSAAEFARAQAAWCVDGFVVRAPNTVVSCVCLVLFVRVFFALVVYPQLSRCQF